MIEKRNWRKTEEIRIFENMASDWFIQIDGNWRN